MGSLSSAKTLGGVGGILAFFPVLNLVGWVLILLATKEISESVQDKTIFDDALLAGITALVGSIVFIVLLSVPRVPVAFGALFFLPFLTILGAFWIFVIISAIFLKRSYEKISQRLNVSAFASTGMLYLIGAALTIVLVGFLILLIALIFQVVAYFSIPDRPPTPGWSQPPPSTLTPSPVVAPQPQVQSRFCYVCGNKLPVTAVFCPNCGTKQP
jgi:uncharacterized membrane protein